MGGGGGSSSTQQNTTQNTTNTDNRAVIGENGVSAQGGSTVNYTNTTTDDGAITAAIGLATSVTTAAQSDALDSLNTSTSAITQAYASSRGQGALTEYVLIGAMALCGIIAYVALTKK